MFMFINGKKKEVRDEFRISKSGVIKIVFVDNSFVERESDSSPYWKDELGKSVDMGFIK